MGDEMQGFRVVEAIENAHPLHGEAYPLLPGDLLVREPSGTWAKEAPGLGVCGFVLTVEQEASLEPVGFTRSGLNYHVVSSTA